MTGKVIVAVLFNVAGMLLAALGYITKLGEPQTLRDALARNLTEWRKPGEAKNRAAEFCALIESSGEDGSASG